MPTKVKAARRNKAKATLAVNGGPAETVTDYRYRDKRTNNPPAGLVTYDRTAPSRKLYSYDPHLDPQLVWSGKAERLSYDVENVALHIHERVSTSAIVRAVLREPVQPSLFNDPQLPLNQQIEFYQHEMNWANRLVLGDSLFVMNSLLERELMAGKVQMIYMDPPYGVKFSSNFQPRVDRRDVAEKDEDLTREPEMIKAYRDTWTLGVHSYLTYLRDRLLLSRELLADSGSIFVQISDENIHRVRALLDEIFGASNFVNQIAFQKSSGRVSDRVDGVYDFIIWYAKDREQMKFRKLYRHRTQEQIDTAYNYIQLSDGSCRALTAEELDGTKPIPAEGRRFRPSQLYSQTGGESSRFSFKFDGVSYGPPSTGGWRTNAEGLNRLANANRLAARGRYLAYKMFADDFPYIQLHNIWTDVLFTSFGSEKLYTVQTSPKVVERCMLMTTDPGDLVLDSTCGSGTTGYVAEQWGRRWITIDTSRVALFLARQRLLTATLPYYKLAHPERGVSGGFIYKSVPHVTLRSIAQNEPSEQETLYDQPEVDRKKVRVSGPFTVEAIPVPAMEDPSESVIPQYESSLGTDFRVDDIARRGRGDGRIANPADDHVTTMIELLRKAGVVFPGGKKMTLENLRPLHLGWLHAEGETIQNGKTPPKNIRVAVSFGPRHGPISAVQTHEALQTARLNGFNALVLAGFSIDPEAQAFIQKNPVKNFTTHFANVNPDVLVGDLLKTSHASQLFTVFGSPDVKLEPQPDGSCIVRLLGVDVYDPNTGELHQSHGENVPAWFLDQDYDGYTFCISQAFFPAKKDAWKKLERALKGKLDPEKFEALQGTLSLPFQPGQNSRIAVKVIDARGNETIRVMPLAQERISPTSVRASDVEKPSRNVARR